MRESTYLKNMSVSVGESGLQLLSAEKAILGGTSSLCALFVRSDYMKYALEDMSDKNVRLSSDSCYIVE